MTTKLEDHISLLFLEPNTNFPYNKQYVHATTISGNNTLIDMQMIGAMIENPDKTTTFLGYDSKEIVTVKEDIQQLGSKAYKTIIAHKDYDLLRGEINKKIAAENIEAMTKDEAAQKRMQQELLKELKDNMTPEELARLEQDNNPEPAA